MSKLTHVYETNGTGTCTYVRESGVVCGQPKGAHMFRAEINTDPLRLADLLPGLNGGGHPSGLASWWRKLADEEIRRTVPKAEEYGSGDLIRIGRTLAEVAGRTVTDEEAAELGIFFYIEGKLARWADAVARGERPSDDTLFDLGVYVRMAQRVRHSGGWPTAPLNRGGIAA